MSTSAWIANYGLKSNKSLAITQRQLALYAMRLLVVFFLQFLSCLKVQDFMLLTPEEWMWGVLPAKCQGSES